MLFKVLINIRILRAKAENESLNHILAYEMRAFLRFPIKKAIKTTNTSAPKAAPTMIGTVDVMSSTLLSASHSFAVKEKLNFKL